MALRTSPPSPSGASSQDSLFSWGTSTVPLLQVISPSTSCSRTEEEIGGQGEGLEGTLVEAGIPLLWQMPSVALLKED